MQRAQGKSKNKRNEEIFMNEQNANYNGQTPEQNANYAASAAEQSPIYAAPVAAQQVPQQPQTQPTQTFAQPVYTPVYTAPAAEQNPVYTAPVAAQQVPQQPQMQATQTVAQPVYTPAYTAPAAEQNPIYAAPVAAQQVPQQPQVQPPQTVAQPVYTPAPQPKPVGAEPPAGYRQKSKTVAGLLAIFLGAFGVHSFYLGKTWRGVAQILITLFTYGLGALAMQIWGVIEGIRLLCGRIPVDGNGVFLRDYDKKEVQNVSDDKLKKFFKIAIPIGLGITAVWVVAFIAMVVSGAVQF